MNRRKKYAKRSWRARVISIQLCLLAIVLCETTQARADLLGTLNHNESWGLEFRHVGSPPGVVALTVTFIDARGRQDVDVFTLPVTETHTIYNNANISSNIRRIVIQLDFPCVSNVGTMMSIWQGEERPTFEPWRIPIASQATCEPRYVFDVVDASQ